MASDKGAKQRRQAQNRVQREQLAARRDAAKAKAKGASGTASNGAAAPRSRWQKLLGPPPARSSSAKTTAGAGPGARSAKPVRPGPDFLRRFGYEEPGGRAVHFAVVLTVAASVMALLYPIIGLNSEGVIPKHKPPTGAPADYAKIVKHVTLLQNRGAGALLLVGAPVVVALITVLLARPGTRKRTWGIGALALFLWVILGQMTFFFVPAAAMGFGWWQAGKEEREARMAQAQKARASGAKGGRAKPGAKPAGMFGGLFKPRTVVDTTASEAEADTAVGDADTDVGEETVEGVARDAGDSPPARGRRSKPTKADVAAAIEAGRRGQRRGPKR